MGTLLHLQAAIRKSVDTGKKDEELLDLQDKERGLEAFVAAGINVYSMLFIVRNHFDFFASVFSIALGTFGLAMYLHEQLDLDVVDDFSTGEDSDEEDSETTELDESSE